MESGEMVQQPSLFASFPACFPSLLFTSICHLSPKPFELTIQVTGMYGGVVLNGGSEYLFRMGVLTSKLNF